MPPERTRRRHLSLPFPGRCVLPGGLLPWVLCALVSAAGSQEITGKAPPDTLELESAQAEKSAPAPSEAGRIVIIPSEVDRQLGNLADLLQRAAGVHVTRSGGLGDYLGVSIWGGSESQVNVYVDGVPRNQANDPSLFLGDWDLSRVERIEIYKGLAPDRLPGAPMGGAINIVTRGKPGPSARAAVGAGSFGGLRANGAAEYARNGARARFEAARDQSDGDFPYYDDNGTEFEPGPHPEGAARLTGDELTRKIRRNNAHAFSSLSADFSCLPVSGLETGLRAEASHLCKQIPAAGADIDSTVAVGARRMSDRVSARGYAAWSKAGAEASLDLSADRLTDSYVDTSRGGGAVGIGYDDDRNAYTDLIASLRGRLESSGGLSLSALISYGLSEYAYTDRLADRTYSPVRRYTGEAKTTPAITRGNHTLEAILSASLILEEQSGPGGSGYGGHAVPPEAWSFHRSLRIGYQYRPRPDWWLTVQGGDAYRVPTFMERFGDRGTILANPNLRPEAGVNGSLGLHGEARGYTADVQGFAAQGRRIISLQQNAQFVLVYRNAGSTRILGLEARLSAAPRPWTRTDLDLTLMKAARLSGASASGAEGYRLIPYRPVTQASLRQTFTLRGWTLAATGYYQGLAYPNASNQASLFDSYSHNTEWQARADADLSWRIRHFLLAAGVHNLSDERNFDFFNFPLPGRSFTACVQADY